MPVTRRKLPIPYSTYPEKTDTLISRPGRARKQFPGLGLKAGPSEKWTTRGPSESSLQH